MPNDRDAELLTALDAAVASILQARVLAGVPAAGDTPPTPVDALDAALARDPRHQTARRASADAIGDLRAVLGPEHIPLLLTVEECLRAEGVTCTDKAWALGVGVSGAGVSGK